MILNKLDKIILVLADVHFGASALTSKELYKQLKKYVLSQLKKMSRIDAVIIAGDLMDTMVSFNSPDSYYIIRFMTKLADLSREFGFEIHVLRGTYSHDGNQLDNFYPLVEDTSIKMYIHTHPTVIYLLDEFKTLFLPDGKYNKKEREELDRLLDDTYDMVVGHGLFDSHRLMHQESENMPVNPVLYPIKKLKENVAGPVIFGHVHSYQNISDKLFYVGSFTRLEANTEACGFMIFRLNSENKSDYDFTRVINMDSTEFFKIKVYEEDLVEIDIHAITTSIDQVVHGLKANDRLMIKLYLSEKPFVTDKVMILHERYRNDSRVYITKKIVNKNKDAVEKKLKEDRVKYSYILDPNMSFNDKIIRYFEEDVRPTNMRYSTLTLNSTILDRIFKVS